MSNTDNIRIFLDMDGVLCDFVGGVCKLFDTPKAELEREWKPDESSLSAFLGTTRPEMWFRIEEEGVDFWHDLEVFPWAYDLWVQLNRIAPTQLLTTPAPEPASGMANAFSVSGKVMWLNRHMSPCGSEPFRDYFFAQHKGFVSSPGSFLVDDRQFVCDEFEHGSELCGPGGGVSVLFPNTFNTKASLVPNAIEHTVSAVRAKIAEYRASAGGSK